MFQRPLDTFTRRHVAPREADTSAMLETLGLSSFDELVDRTIPKAIRLGRKLDTAAGLEDGRGEAELIDELREVAARNVVNKSYIGQGYYGTVLPPVVQRNVLENPGWYTQYTPYQAEISQGRLEALLNFQTMVSDLTGLPMAGASLLDEATAAAEAMSLCLRAQRGKGEVFFASELCFPQTLAVLRTRAEMAGITLVVGNHEDFTFEHEAGRVFGALVQYPDVNGEVRDYAAFCERAHAAKAMVVAAADILSLALLTPPGEWGADVAVGSCQRFGVPMAYGGPHAGYLSTSDSYKRFMPGRLIGVSKDTAGNPALRMAMQTREQHIRRDKATSNICTSQVLLANLAGFYGTYHGPDGLRAIAERVHGFTAALATALVRHGLVVETGTFFDTLVVAVEDAAAVHAAGLALGLNLRHVDDTHVGLSIDESTDGVDLQTLFAAFGGEASLLAECLDAQPDRFADGGGASFARTSEYMTHPVFNSYQAEHEMLRYMRRLESKDLSLTTSMISLGSCTMKLNATSQMLPITWPEFAGLHPFCPKDQATGYAELVDRLDRILSEITGFAKMSFQPNAGSQGEYAGLLAIRRYHEANGQGHRNICLIPTSAHGTNPASAVMAGMQVVTVACDENGNIDVADLAAKAEAHGDNLAALMVTYPSTHGVFEAAIVDVCAKIHEHGGQVYLDGANMNAQVGLCRPGDYGADVCHLNLHKTFAIPHGGGGPGVGPIGVQAHLVPFLPGDPVADKACGSAGAVSAAEFGSAGILPISYMYCALLGVEGLELSTKVAILNANYMAKRLSGHYDVLYTGEDGFVAHEFILDLRPFEAFGIHAEDVAKRLMDYGFHAPTMSFPVVGTLMVEPTESESRQELDRFVDAMILIRAEIAAIEAGTMDREDNPLLNAPHTAGDLASDDWSHPYSREQAVFPTPWTRTSKFWPSVKRIDNGYGDRNLICSCPPIDAYEEEPAPEPVSV
ncbi:MAG: aminomethyl-transferring glycine dehydrogenase [Planctomycetota bacterium]|nr:aminomethyl-transferring glycine dehydrogenase [Planctomycetota bacterium]